MYTDLLIENSWLLLTLVWVNRHILIECHPKLEEYAKAISATAENQESLELLLMYLKQVIKDDYLQTPVDFGKPNQESWESSERKYISDGFSLF